MRNSIYFTLFFVPYLFFSCSSDDDFTEDFEKQGLLETINVVSSINVDDSLKIKDYLGVEIEKFFSFKTKATTTNQGFAIYNNKLFQCYHSNSIIDVIDLDIKEVTNSILLEPEELVHCNNVNFGGYFYDFNDKYPLLYVQQRGYANKLNAYRILVEGDSIFTAELVQTISFSPCFSSVTSISRESNILYVFYDYHNKRYLSTFYLPDFRGGDVSLEMKNALKTYLLPSTKVIQDTAADDKYLYFLCGYSYEGELWQIDMDTNEARVIDFPSYNYKSEPEGIDCYEDGLLVTFGRIIYKVKLE